MTKLHVQVKDHNQKTPLMMAKEQDIPTKESIINLLAKMQQPAKPQGKQQRPHKQKPNPRSRSSAHELGQGDSISSTTSDITTQKLTPTPNPSNSTHSTSTPNRSSSDGNSGDISEISSSSSKPTSPAVTHFSPIESPKALIIKHEDRNVSNLCLVKLIVISCLAILGWYLLIHSPKKITKQ